MKKPENKIINLSQKRDERAERQINTPKQNRRSSPAIRYLSDNGELDGKVIDFGRARSSISFYLNSLEGGLIA